MSPRPIVASVNRLARRQGCAALSTKPRAPPTDKETTSEKPAEPEPSKPPSKDSPVLLRDKEIQERLLEREGGANGISIVDGKYEGGLGKESKKNMFRLI